MELRHAPEQADKTRPSRADRWVPSDQGTWRSFANEPTTTRSRSRKGANEANSGSRPGEEASRRNEPTCHPGRWAAWDDVVFHKTNPVLAVVFRRRANCLRRRIRFSPHAAVACENFGNLDTTRKSAAGLETG